MKFEKFIPSARLQPFVKYFVIAEGIMAYQYKVFPSTGLVTGFQYNGQLALVKEDKEHILTNAGITGIADSFRIFKNLAATGTVLVYFTETGLSHFSDTPANELFNQSVSLDNLFDKLNIAETEEKLAEATTGLERIGVIEQFLTAAIKDRQADKLIAEAVKLIYAADGAIKIKAMTEKLFISQSPFEKRFRKQVGTSPKKFASIVRFNAVINNLRTHKSLTELCYEHQFFDQAHFIKDFKQYTGNTPENFKQFI